MGSKPVRGWDGGGAFRVQISVDCGVAFIIHAHATYAKGFCWHMLKEAKTLIRSILSKLITI